MSRHRNLKNIDISEERDEYHEYGQSVEDDAYCMSPTNEQFMFDRNESSHRLADYMGIKEEDEFPDADDGYDDSYDGCTQGAVFQLDEIARPADGTSPKSRPPTVPQNTPKATIPKPKTPLESSVKKGVARLNLGDGSGDLGDIKGGGTPRRGQSPAPSQHAKLLSPKFPSSPRSSSPAPASGRSTPVVAKPRLKERPTGGKDLLNMVVIGHVDAGKSTLMGHTLYLLGEVSQRVMHKNKQEAQKLGKSSFAYAWVLDETGEERERGVTMDIAQSRFETETKRIVLLDAPGHKDFIPNMITGAAQADVALLVANATRGEFETGLDLGGQTREHTMLVRSLGVRELAVVVNKMDTVQWAKDRYEEVVAKLGSFVKQAGFPDARFVPASGLTGINLHSSPPSDHPLAHWYQGPTLLQVIDQFKSPPRLVDSPMRLCITDVFRAQGSGGFLVAGKVQTGALQTQDKVLILPNAESALIKSVQTDEGGLDAGAAFAGDQCLVVLVNADQRKVSPGHVICHPETPIPVVTRFQARLVIFNVIVPITKGFPAVLHYQNVCESVVIRRLISHLHKTTGELVRKKPRCLTRNSSGVVELQSERPLCLEEYSVCKELGRITLRDGGKTIAAGLVTKLVA